MFRAYLVSGLFILLISFPFINDRFHLIVDTQNVENRRLSKKPAFDIERLDPYPVAFEKFYNDTFSLRSRIINYFNIYNCVFLHKSTFPSKIIIGRNHWLYIVGPDIETYLGRNRLTEKELQTFKAEFEYRRTYLAVRNCQFYVLIAPGKANVHSENLPFTFIRENTQCWGEQLNAFMTENSQVNMIDVFGPFKKIKSEIRPLYISDDNHWNHLGAFEAARISVDQMSKQIPGLKPLDIRNYKIQKQLGPSGNLRLLLGNLQIFQSYKYDIQPYSGFQAKDFLLPQYPPPAGCPSPESYAMGKEMKLVRHPRLLIFSDSFGGAFFPFISESFGRTVKIFYGWQYRFFNEIIDQEKPDAVLLLVHEPLVRNILQNLSYPGHEASQ